MVSTPVADLIAAGALQVEDGNHGEYRPRRGEFVNDGVCFIRAADMSHGVIDFQDSEKINDVAVARVRKGIGRPHDSLLSHKGTVGRVAFAPPDAPAYICSPQTTFWRSNDYDSIDPRFLYYSLVSSHFQNQLASRHGESDMAPYVSLTEQRKLTLRLPSIQYQKLIVDVLGALDDKIAVNERIAKSSHDLAVAHYEQTTVDRTAVPLAEVVDPILGGTPDRHDSRYWGPGVLWASAKDVAGCQSGCLLSTAESITETATEIRRFAPVPRGSVLLTARGTVGAVARVCQDTSLNQSCYALLPGKLPPAVLYLAVLSAAKQMLSVAHGTVFSTLNMKSLNHLYAPLMTAAENESVERLLSPLLDTVEVRLRENRTLAALRGTLLPKLMSGELRVRDAERAVDEVM